MPDQPVDAIFLDRLCSVVGENGVLTGADSEPFLNDHRRVYSCGRAPVVRPRSVDQVAEVVRICADSGVVIVPQGGNTGLSGGAVVEPDRTSVVLSTTLLNKIEALDDERATMTVQAGVTVEAIQNAAATRGLQFAPDWGARGTATIGGGIATNAGGNNVVRYGGMRSHILGLEVVLADGRVLNMLRSLRKDSSGYDLKQLLIGSEGTLGVVTRAVVSLVAATPHSQSAFAAVADLDRLADLTTLIRRSAGAELTAFELVPDIGVDLVCEHYGVARPIETRSEFYVLIKLAGVKPVFDALVDLLAEAVEDGLLLDAVVAESTSQNEALWFIRDELPPERYYEYQALALKLDTAIPTDHIREFLVITQEITTEVSPGAVCYGFGHVGDGNIHMRILPIVDDDVEHFVSARPELVARIDAATWDLGGTLSAEHGIGIELVDRIEEQKSAVEWDLMRSVKAALDPAGLMNPGKVLPPHL
ncbi:MAG: FAD-binding oxidoreductase [Actinomycetia bacterium]|nr:FAD-binding oxidoreductase [Actinomycetes bacterium]MCP4960023.1 FAD-binding oxidoreductase [Actinomycetes bacterium]